MKKYIVVFIGITQNFYNNINADSPKKAVNELFKQQKYIHFEQPLDSRKTDRKHCDFIVKDITTKKYSYFAIV